LNFRAATFKLTYTDHRLAIQSPKSDWPHLPRQNLLVCINLRNNLLQ